MARRIWASRGRARRTMARRIWASRGRARRTMARRIWASRGRASGTGGRGAGIRGSGAGGSRPGRGGAHGRGAAARTGWGSAGAGRIVRARFVEAVHQRGEIQLPGPRQGLWGARAVRLIEHRVTSSLTGNRATGPGDCFS